MSSIHGESSWAPFVCADLIVPHIDGPGTIHPSGGTHGQILPHVTPPVILAHPVLHRSEPGKVLGVILCPGVELEGNSEQQLEVIKAAYSITNLQQLRQNMRSKTADNFTFVPQSQVGVDRHCVFLDIRCAFSASRLSHYHSLNIP